MTEVFNPFSLSGKTILVTGASSGIGRGIAIACSKMGGSVIICARNEERLKETFGLLLPNDNHHFYSVDLNDTERVNEMVSVCPKLDGIVHCAGIGQFKTCKQIENEDIMRLMSTNFCSPVLLQSEILKQKKINKGSSIVFIASIASFYPYIGNAIYSASKGAIVSYSKVLSKELAPRLIRVNCISPAMVRTEFLTKTPELVADVLDDDEKNYPLKRYGTPDDIANLAVYLISDASSWMTGTNIPITGGFCYF